MSNVAQIKWPSRSQKDIGSGGRVPSCLIYSNKDDETSCHRSCHTTTCPMSHHYGVQCLFMWSARWSERENDRWQRWHLNGFVPVCFLVCLKRAILVFWRQNSRDMISTSDRECRQTEPLRGATKSNANYLSHLCHPQHNCLYWPSELVTPGEGPGTSRPGACVWLFPSVSSSMGLQVGALCVHLKKCIYLENWLRYQLLAPEVLSA